MAAPELKHGRPLDARALLRLVTRVHQAPQAPWLHGEVAKRMAQRLALIRTQPTTVIDWWSHLGAGAPLVARAYPKAHIVAVEPDGHAQAKPSGPWWLPRRWVGRGAEVFSEAALGDRRADLLWANMGLHFTQDVEALMASWRRHVTVDGFLMFSTLGPGSLEHLSKLYRAQGWPPPFAPFVDMHDLGDMLVQAGFADPVMDQEQITLTWASADELLAELRSLGANVDPRRLAGLRTPRWRARLVELLSSTRNAEGRIGLNFEVVYGHAFCPPPRHALAPSASVPLEDMKAMVRAGRRRL